MGRSDNNSSFTAPRLIFCKLKGSDYNDVTVPALCTPVMVPAVVIFSEI